MNFQEDFNKGIAFLHEDNNLQVFEELTKMYLQSNTDYSVSKFIDYQVNIFNVFNKHAGVLLHFLKINNANEIKYGGPFNIVFKRLLTLRKMAHVHFVNIDNAISAPQKIKGNTFTYNNEHPHDLTASIIRNDGNYFKFSFNFNDGLNLATAIIENLVHKMDKGINNINREDYYRLKDEYKMLSLKVDDLIAEEDEKHSVDNEKNKVSISH
jgi:hypothetical protein